MTEIQNTNQVESPTQNKQVLVAIDLSEDAKAALLWACRFAESTHARLVLLHVVHDPASSPGFYRLSNQSRLRPMQEVAELMMAEFLADMINTYPELDALKSAETLFVEGLPPGRIVETADELNAELIVIGSRGMTGLPHLMLGSVAERVVELATLPVVVVKADTHDKKHKKDLKKMQKAVKKKLKKMKSDLEKQSNSDE